MSIISITIIASSTQVIDGIPQYVSLSTNIPSSIFYSFGKDPVDTSSNIYVGPIKMPTNREEVLLNIFATDGVDSSPIISQRYFGTIVGDRIPHATVTNLNQTSVERQNLYPFGEFTPNIPVTYGSTGGITADSTNPPNYPDGYDGTATGTSPGGTDLPLYDYDLTYSDSTSQGIVGKGLGDLPATVTIRVPEPINPKESSNINSKFFNSKAMVIYQDSRDTPIDNAPQIMRQFSALENSETVKNGALLFSTGFEGLQPTGGLLRPLYNPNNNTITYYFFDSSVNRWIVSIEPYTPKNANIGNYANIVFSPRNQADHKVFRWITFKGSRLI